MSSSYVNDLRLEEIGTGDQSGTWGTTTNTNLELIGEALGYGTQDCFTSDADATTTVADGATDPARSMYFKVTSSATLTATRTLTIAPNTISRVMFIENATTGSQSITISQGSGANVTIATGKTAVVYLDGAGATAAVVDALALVDPGVTDTLAEVLTAGNTSSGTNIELTTTDKVQFRDSAIYLNSSADGQLDIVADTEVQIATTTVDLNGILDVSGNTTLGADVTFTGASYNVVWDSSDNALEFADNAKAVFGDGSDLEIYHDGSNSYISDTGTGSLLLSGSAQILLVAAGTSESLAAFVKDGGAYLYHNNAQKLETTSTGIDVTGTVVADSASVTGDVYVQTADGASAFYVTRYGTITTESAKFYVDDNNLIIDSIQDEQFGGFIFKSTYSGTGTRNRLGISNITGDISFYEDTGTTAKFFWDASAESLGIGTSTLSNAKLQINTATTDTAGTGLLGFAAATGGPLWNWRMETGDSDLILDRFFGSWQSSPVIAFDRSTGNVGIGASSPGAKLEVASTTDGDTLRISFPSAATGSTGGGIQFRAYTNSATLVEQGRIQTICTDGSASYGGAMRFMTAGSGTLNEAMRIDSSGNLLVGKTTSGIGVTGSEILAGGQLLVTADGDNPVDFNRKTSDGIIANFRKDGSTVGSIGSRGAGTSYITLKATTGAGAGLTGTDNGILPMDESALADNNTDLGSGSYRFKDLYLSGGAYLGGVAAANLLDDYEEGTWTPTDDSGDGLSITTNGVSYTKIGRLCYIYAYITYPSTASGSTQKIGGLPFTAKGSQTYAQITVRVTSNTVSASNLTFQVATSDTVGIIHSGATGIVNSDLSTQSILISGCYEVA